MNNGIIEGFKDWVIKAISHIQTEKVPYNYGFTPPARKKLADYYGSDEVEKIIKLPMRWNSTNSIKPSYPSPKEFGTILKDEFGVGWALSEINRGAPSRPALPEANLSNYKFPNPAEEYRFKGLKEWCEENQVYYKVLGVGDLWERATFMRGMENVLVDLILNKNFVFKLLRSICDYVLETMKILINRFEFEECSLGDDYGSQRSLQMSPKDWRTFIKPFLKEIIDYSKKNNKFFMLHSCGNVTEIIPDLIDLGVDILHPIQSEVMNIYDLKKEYGKYLTFQGGLSTQKLLPYGTSEEIIDRIKELKTIIGKDGGFILDTGISIQGDVPLENLLTMIKASQDVI